MTTHRKFLQVYHAEAAGELKEIYGDLPIGSGAPVGATRSSRAIPSGISCSARSHSKPRHNVWALSLSW